MDLHPPENFLTTKEASKLSGYNSNYLGQLCNEGKIVGKKVGRSWTVESNSLQAFVLEREERKREIARGLAQERARTYRKSTRIRDQFVQVAHILPPRTLAVGAATLLLTASSVGMGASILRNLQTDRLATSLTAAVGSVPSTKTSNAFESLASFTYHSVNLLWVPVGRIVSLFTHRELASAPRSPPADRGPPTPVNFSVPTPSARTEAVRTQIVTRELVLSGISKDYLSSYVSSYVDSSVGSLRILLNKQIDNIGSLHSRNANVPQSSNSFNASNLTLEALTVTGDASIEGIFSAATSTLGTVTATGPFTLASIIGTTQCLHVDALGVVSGTGSDCGTGGGGSGGVSTTTANVWSALQQFNGNASTSALSVFAKAYFGATATSSFSSTGALTLSGSFTGPLQAINGAVTSTSTISTFYGGTGLSSAPSFGQILVGNSLGGYTLTATSSLGIASAFTATYPIQYAANILSLAFSTTTNNIWSGSNSFTAALTAVNASTTNLSAYTAAFGSTATSSFSNAGVLTLAGGLNGPLQANNGVISATSSIGVRYGGTGLTTVPTFGQVLVGNSLGGYTLTATSSLGITGSVASSTSGSLPYYAANGNALSATSSLYVSTSGYFGIGTTSPYAKLSVHSNNGEINPVLFAVGSSTASATTTLFSISNTGSTTASNGFNISSGCYAINGTCIGSGSFTNTLANGGTATTTFYSGGVLYSDGSKLTQASGSSGAVFTWDNTNGRLGIGTTTPGSKLSVTGAGSSGARALTVANSSNVEVFTILDNARVGIGSSPASADSLLYVRALSDMTGLGYMKIVSNTGGVLTAMGTNSGNAIWQFYNSSNVEKIRFDAGSDSYIMGGNLGIGVSGPATKVDIGGTNDNLFRVVGTGSASTDSIASFSSAAGTILVMRGNGNSGFASSTPFGQLSVNPTSVNGSAPSFVIGSSTGTSLIVTNAGKIGVGTTSPYATFSVNTTAGLDAFAVGSSTGTYLKVTALGTTSALRLDITGTATSSFASGINLSTGCFAINGACVSGGAAFSNTLASGGTATTTFYSGGVLYSDGSKLTQASGSGTSIFSWDNTNGRLGLGTSTPFGQFSVNPTGLGTAPAFVVGSSSATSLIVTNGGNVGIGTAAPAEKFTVEGTAPNIEVRSGGSLMLRPTANNWDMRLRTDGSSSSAYLSIYSGGDLVNPRMVVQAGGNVGIGTISPQGAFDVQNKFRVSVGAGATGELYAGTSIDSYSGANIAFLASPAVPSTYGVQFGAYNGTSWKSVLEFSNAVGTPNLLLQKTGGSVGIGIASPDSSTQLHVSGSNSGATTIQGRFENTSASGRSQLIVTSGTYPNNFFSLMTHGASFAGDNYLSDSTGDAGLGILLGQGTEMTKFAVGTYNATPLSFFTSNTQRLYISSTGSVGIGTTTPGSLLSVQGIANFTTATSTLYGSGGINLTAGCFSVNGTCVGSGSFTNNIASGGTGTTTFYSGGVVFSDGLRLTQASSTSDFFWDSTNKRLGLGTSTPYALLSVNPTSSLGTAPAFVVGSSSATSLIVSNAGYVGIGTSTPRTSLDVASGNAQFGIFSGSPLVSITPNGNNGLITAFNNTPGDPVSGISTGAVLGFNGSPTNFYGVGLGTLRNSKYDIWFQTGATNGGGYRWYTGTAETMMLTNTGNLGLGTTPTTYSNFKTFALAGTSGSVIDFLTSSTRVGQIYNDANSFNFYTVGNQYMAFAPNAVEAVRFTAAGSVGVGTTSPWRTLSVTGTVALSGVTVSNTGNYLCLNANGEVTSGTTCTTSSERFKHNILPLTEGGLDEVLALQPVTFEFNPGYGDNGSTTQFGFIAEDAYRVDPRLVPLDSEGKPAGFMYQNYTAILTKAIQELNGKVELRATAASFEGIIPFLATTSPEELLSASSTVSSTTPWIGSFGAVSVGLKDALGRMSERVVHILGKSVYAVTGVFDTLFAREVHTDQVCIGGTCLTEDQIKTIIQQSGQGVAPNGGGGSSEPLPANPNDGGGGGSGKESDSMPTNPLAGPEQPLQPAGDASVGNDSSLIDTQTQPEATGEGMGTPQSTESSGV